MAVEVITKEDLEQFRLKLLNDLKIIIKDVEKPVVKKWLRSYEVKSLLKISSGTLQNLVGNDTLRPKKIGGLNYYDSKEIEDILNKPMKDNNRRS